MDRLHLSFELLAQETIHLSRQWSLCPDAPGFLYSLHCSGGTFVIKGRVCDGPCDKDTPWAQTLDQEDAPLSFFEVHRVEQAQVLRDHVVGPRMPIDEDSLYNLSDPGPSWWLDLGPGAIGLDARKCRPSCQGRYLRLGPLGDQAIFARRFSELQKLALGAKISIGARRIDLVAESDPHLFEEIKELFLTGQLPSDSQLMFLLKDRVTLRLFMEEVALLRRFWAQVETQLTSFKGGAFGPI